MRNVGVISCGFSEHASKRNDVSVAELCNEAVKDALKKCPDLKLKDIQAFTFGNMQAFEGANYPELVASEHIGAYRKPILRIATGGTTGMTVFHGGYYHIASGLFDIVAAISFEKNGSEGDTQFGLGAILFPEVFSLIQYGIDLEAARAGAGGGGSTGGASFQALSYLKRSGAIVEDFSRAVVKNRRNAAKNPYAHLKMPNLTVEEVEKTAMIAYPLRFGHTCPTTDGACVMILASEEYAKKLCPKPAWVKAVASCSGDPTFQPGGAVTTDPAEQMPAILASKKAYQIAGIKEPQKEIDLAEVYDAFGHQELMWSERLGLFDEGKGPEKLRQGVTQMDGELPINCSGGVISTNSIGSTAMERAAEAALQVMGQAGEHQAKKPVKNAIGHGWGGLFQFVSVAIFSDTPHK